jgi:phosphoglucosamine mutase
MKSLFGTDGIRGEAGTYPLDPPTIYACARSLAVQLTQRWGRPPRVVTGRDTRESGRWIEGIVTRGLRDMDADVISAGIMTTPGIAYLTRSQQFDAGVVVSASHNPIPDNGIKIFSATGAKLDDELELAIEADIRDATPVRHLGTVWLDDGEDLRRHYLDYLIQDIGHNMDLDGLKIGLDCANGAAYEIAPAVMKALGAEVQAWAVEPDGLNINQGCGAVHIEALSNWVRKHGCDLGIAFDGDADRALFVGHDGRVFDGDHIMFIVANDLKRRGQLNADLVVGTVMSNWGLEKALQERNITLLRTSVGDRYVLEKLLELNGSIGGEQSGHIIFPHISLAGDGLITAIETLRIITETGADLYQLSHGFTQYPQLLVNVPVKTKTPFEQVPAIAAHQHKVEQLLEGRGRLLLRYSGTENKARVMIEADDANLVNTLTHQLADTIKEHLGSL